MNANTKAIELIDKFKKATSYKYQEYAGAHLTVFEHDIEELVNCATIFVDDMIEELDDVKNPYIDDCMVFDWNNKVIKFWEDVKNELQKLR